LLIQPKRERNGAKATVMGDTENVIEGEVDAASSAGLIGDQLRVAEDRLNRRNGSRRLLSLPRRTVDVLWVLGVFTATLVIWQVVVLLQLFPSVALPSPLEVAQGFGTLSTVGYQGQTLWQDTLVSSLRILGSFSAAVIVGVLVGLLMARSRVVFRVIDPYLQFVRPIPPLAYIPLMVVWFGIDELPKVLLIFIGTVPVIIINTLSGVAGIPVQRFQLAQCLGANDYQIFRYVTIPSTLPDVFTGMRVGIGAAWTCLVAAELIAATSGLGWMIQSAGQFLQTPYIIVGILVIGVIGYAMDLLVRGAERVVVPWKGKGH
jgi:ABC-type nitrate/sulfonate/bicarbonate transport system permease component